jgi:tetratricopeptide (TPR) repeat protein
VALARRLLLQPEDGRSAASLVGRLALRGPAECCVAAAAGSALAPARLTAWHLEQAVAQEPDHYWAHFYQGIAAYRAQRFNDAAIAFRVAVALRPRHPGGYHNRALAAAGAGDLNQALADYTKALELDPSFYAAAWNRGLVHVKLRDYEAALADLRIAQARGADPQAIQADINRVTQMRKSALPLMIVLHQPDASARDPGTSSLRTDARQQGASLGRAARRQSAVEVKQSRTAGSLAYASGWCSGFMHTHYDGRA